MERVELVFMSGADESIDLLLRNLSNFPDREPISHTTVGHLITKFRQTGSVLDKPRSDSPKLSDEIRVRVVEKVENSSKKLLRQS